MFIKEKFLIPPEVRRILIGLNQTTLVAAIHVVDVRFKANGGSVVLLVMIIR